MSTIVRRATILLTLLAVAATAWPVLGADGSTGSRYIVVLKSGTNGVLGVTDAEVATLGGRVEVRLPTRLEVTLPDRAAGVLRSYPAVKYLQRVSTDGRSAEEISAGQSTIMRLHPKTMVVDPPSWNSGTFRYDGSGNIYTIGVAGETAVTPHTYTYDNLSRLTQATNVATQTEKFYYDIYGNMTEHDIGSSSTMIALDSAHNNRLQATGGITYDPVGNLASDATAIYTYDPFSQLREKDFSGSTDNEIYVYTADDERIAVKQNDTWTWSVRDFGGKVLRQYQSSASQPSASWLWMEDYVYRDGLLLGADRPAEEGGRRYMHLDHLGTPRLVTGGNGVKVAEHELAPFGIEPTPLWEDTTHGFDREDPMRFTGHERDFAQLSRMVTTPYLDYMHARYHNPGVGRFLSVDPVVNAASAAGSPQRWNRYSYSLNNPLRYLDPDGRDPQESVKRFLLIGYLLYSHGLLDPKIHFTVASKSPIAKKALGGVGVKGLDYFGVDVTDSLNKGSKNSLDITYQNDGLGVETVLSFNGIVPTLDELYATGGPFEKSLFSKDEDKLSLGVALAGGVTVEQKLDKLLPVLFEYMSMSTEELIVEVAEQLDKEGYRIIDGQLVLLKQKK